MDIASNHRKYVASALKNNNIKSIKTANGITLTTSDDKEYTDLTSGWNVANLGWNPPELIDVAKKQLDKLSYCPPWLTNSEKVEIAESYSQLLNGDYKMIPAVSGSDAVEMALKVAIRKTGRKNFIGFTHSYHGATLAALHSGELPSIKDIYIENSENRYLKVPDYNRIKNKKEYLESLILTIRKKPLPAAIILEVIFSNPGVIIGDNDFYKTIERAARDVNALIIVDEIGNGFGRTGTFFGFENFDISPDIIAISKAITSGVVPMAATLIKNELDEFVKGVGFYSTYGCTPLAAKVAKENLDQIIEKKLPERAKIIGDEAVKLLESLLIEVPNVLEVRGMGLLIGIELVKNKQKESYDFSFMNKIQSDLLEEGIVINYSNYTSTIMIMPPLVIDKETFFITLKKLCHHLVKTFS